ncbi:sodium/potassium/calcium exchanger 5 isoform X2 [Plodia interpunctella]|uniref:sodium/potassium/calcium exchanger 5 isoform X2 n=1 Tax=Plodia interpunctella TaxID=58824 RepID=UPI0023679AEE|nr:sodium/potassium/calcium exchanger 5 isoform X2 [Plodia interpunctella]
MFIVSLVLRGLLFANDHLPQPSYCKYGRIGRGSPIDMVYNITEVIVRNCTPPAIDDFPAGLFTELQRQHGAIVLHAFISIYLFIALAVVCDKFFVPAVDRICHALNMTNDVAGATFMAAATSAPELFVNVIGTFITEGDIGVGTIVGSAVFNILAVAACCGIGAGMVVPLDWWPLTRDCLAYGITVSILICIMHDEYVQWYEAFLLVLLYGVYICIMYYDKSIQNFARGSWKWIHSMANKTDEKQDGKDGDAKEKRATTGDKNESLPEHHQHNGNLKIPITTIPQKDIDLRLSNIEKAVIPVKEEDTDKNVNEADSKTNDMEIGIPEENANNTITEESNKETADKYEHSLWKWPTGRSCLTKTTWIVTWPIHLVFLFTIPDCEKPRFKNWFPLTFMMCIVWIGSLSYIVAWMITIIGDTLMIPDSVMGITFLAAGTSVPEAVSSVIVAKQGHGSMGISNSIGSNTFDILLCLGLPWLIKASLTPAEPGHYWVKINSMGLEYSAISLLSTLLLLYLTFWLNKFKLDAAVGRACLAMYAMFLVLATLIELNVFFPVNMRTCKRTELKS